MNNETLLKNLRCIPDFPVKGINFRDVTTLFKNNECLNIMLEELYEIYKDKGITKIVGIESRGFVMASALALKLGAGIVLCRKPGKLPAATVQESYAKEYGTDTIEIHQDAIRRNDESSLQSREEIQPQKHLRQLYHRDNGRGVARKRHLRQRNRNHHTHQGIRALYGIPVRHPHRTGIPPFISIPVSRNKPHVSRETPIFQNSLNV